MGIAHRMFMIDQQDRLYRLSSEKFYAMLQTPSSYRFPQFAGRRVRAAGIGVEFVNRQPTEVVRATYDIVTFDKRGYVQAETLLAQQSSRAEVAMAPLICDLDGKTEVVETKSRFVAHGGRWTPTRALARTIEDAALGRTRCTRL